jgi:hypothetical protein
LYLTPCVPVNKHLVFPVQTVEEIQRIVREAQTPPAGPAGWDNDEYIDDAMDQEQYESSFDEWGMGTSI